MTVETTLVRVIGHVLSLSPAEQSVEIKRLQRYVNLSRGSLSEEIVSQVVAGELSQVYHTLFPLVHQSRVEAAFVETVAASPFRVSVQEPDIESMPPPNHTEGDEPVEEMSSETVSNTENAEDVAGSLEDGVTSTETHQHTAVSDNAQSLDDEPDELVESSVEGDQDEGNLEAENDASSDAPEPSKPSEPSEPEWPEYLREKLLKRFRSKSGKSKRKSSKYANRSSVSSRWEFWHPKSGLLGLADALNALQPPSVWYSIFTQTIERLAERDVETVGDLLLKAPSGYKKFPFSTLDKSVNEGETTLRGNIVSRYVTINSMFKRWTVVIQGKDDVTLTCTWAGSPPRGWSKWKVGAMVGFAGTIEMDTGLLMRNPEPIGLDGRGSGLLAEYDTADVEDIEIRNLIAFLLEELLSSVQDSLPKEVVEKAGVLALEDALREAHFPSNQNYRGRSRLAYEEVFLYHIGKRLNSKFVSANGIGNRVYHSALAHFAWVNGVELSDAQEEVLSDIRRDMLMDQPMRRLLQGDVGAGKPMVALFAALSLFDHNTNAAKKSKGRTPKRPLVVYVCNDELSAERRFTFMEGAFKMLGIQCKMMTGKPSKAESNILESEGGMVVVTNEVLQTRLQALPNIRLVIVEETENFGDNIPFGFIKRSPSPDLLVFTPTPQPMHVLETVYADFALSTISSKDQVLPSSRWVKASERDPVYKQMLDLIHQGRQGLIVWPVVNGKDSIDVKQALQMAGAIQGRYLPDVRMAVYCSSMKKSERIKVFEEFQNKRIDVLLCTTIIEDTPPVGNTTMIIAEKAEVSEVMRLHRLRGHLTNSHYPAFCTYVVSDDASEEAVSLVEQVCDEPDGVELVEWLSRVQGDSQGLELQWAKADDWQVRSQARDLAHTLSLKDLRQCRWPLLNNAVRNWWSDFDVPEHKKVSKSKYRKRKRKR